MSEGRCHVCGEEALEVIREFSSLMQVTSDCRPWRRGGTLAVCAACGSVQKRVDAAWKTQAEEIYRGYALYPQGGGAEQGTFDSAGAKPTPRSRRLLERLTHDVAVPEHGRLLDIGCGNGGLLRAFHELRPWWELEGTEFDERDGAAIQALPGVRGFHTCPPWDVPGRFDLIALMHVLEHIAEPIPFLRRLANKLAPGGRLMVESPNVTENPFDLLIADHATHFNLETLSWLLAKAGYDFNRVACDWVPKELSALVREASTGSVPVSRHASIPLAVCIHAVAWLDAIRRAGRDAAAHANGMRFGIFGTSIAGSWLHAEIGAADFFVDEDEERIGRSFLGRPVLAPASIDPGAIIYVALVPNAARTVAARCERPGGTYLAPPELDEPDRMAQHSAR